jgi:5-(carboxyamino)imidazole ribonucleotide mutase
MRATNPHTWPLSTKPAEISAETEESGNDLRGRDDAARSRGIGKSAGVRGDTMAEIGPQVGIIMGSQSDWETMCAAADVLATLDVAHEAQIVSAHRTPDRLVDYAKGAAARGLKIIIAGAGGAAHLPGMAASMTHLPVLGVPVESKALSGMDSLLSIVQMPGGVPVGTLAIGKAGAINAALLAASILALSDAALSERLIAWRAAQTASVGDAPQ